MNFKNENLANPTKHEVSPLRSEEKEEMSATSPLQQFSPPSPSPSPMDLVSDKVYAIKRPMSAQNEYSSSNWVNRWQNSSSRGSFYPDAHIATTSPTRGNAIDEAKVPRCVLELRCIFNGLPVEADEQNIEEIVISTFLRACATGDVPSVQFLIKKWTRHSDVQEGGISTIGAKNPAPLLLEAKERNTGFTGLITASCCGQIDVVRVLIDRGAAVNAIDNSMYLNCTDFLLLLLLLPYFFPIMITVVIDIVKPETLSFNQFHRCLQSKHVVTKSSFKEC